MFQTLTNYQRGKRNDTAELLRSTIPIKKFETLKKGKKINVSNINELSMGKKEFDGGISNGLQNPKIWTFQYI